MRQGISPMLPKTHCVHRDAQPIPSPERLRIIWLEEGNGAALVEEDPNTGSPKTLAVIPPWSGLEGFHGYSDQCAIESPLCWPIPDNPRLVQRIQMADQFWKSFDSEADPFSALQHELLKVYDAQFLNQTKDAPDSHPAPERDYYQIGGNRFPPRGLVQYQIGHQFIIATVGMSLCPQPAVEIFSENPQGQRRIELAIAVTDESGLMKPDRLEQLRIQISGLAGYPWRNFTWFGAGHTCRFDGIVPDCDSATFVNESQLSHSDRQAIKMPLFRDDPVQLLWLTATDPN